MRSHHVRVVILVATCCIPIAGPAQQFHLSQIGDISPSKSTSTDADAASGGRVNGLAFSAQSPHKFYAASEWGGLFASDDNGRVWKHVDAHVPTSTWKVRVDPTNANRIYATSFYDGKVHADSPLNISEDAGATWHSVGLRPPNGFCEDPESRDQLSATGIAIDGENPSRVYVGTNCGLAVTENAGTSWSFVNPFPGKAAAAVCGM